MHGHPEWPLQRERHHALPPADVLRLATLLGPYFRDPRVAAQTRAVAEICAARNP